MDAHHVRAAQQIVELQRLDAGSRGSPSPSTCGSHAHTVKPNAAARRATARPMRPNPTMPHVESALRLTDPVSTDAQRPPRACREQRLDPPHQAQREGQRVVGHLLGAVAGDVRHRDPQPAGGVHVDPVVAGPELGHHAQARVARRSSALTRVPAVSSATTDESMSPAAPRAARARR